MMVLGLKSQDTFDTFTISLAMSSLIACLGEDLPFAQKLINGICISLFTNFIVWTIWKCKFIDVRKSHCSHFTTINVVKIMALTFLLVLRNSLFFSFFDVQLSFLFQSTHYTTMPMWQNYMPFFFVSTHESWPSLSLHHHHRTVNASNGSIIAVFIATLSSWFGVNTATISCTLF